MQALPFLKGETMDREWNLGTGIENVIDSVTRKLHYAGHQLEEKERTIINLDTYEVTLLIRALSEYRNRRNNG